MKLRCELLFCVGLLVEAFILVQDEDRKVVKVLTVDNGGGWGDWYPPQFCAEGAYATGYTMKLMMDKADVAAGEIHSYSESYSVYPTYVKTSSVQRKGVGVMTWSFSRVEILYMLTYKSYPGPTVKSHPCHHKSYNTCHQDYPDRRRLIKY